MVETCKLNDVGPLAYLTDALTSIVNRKLNSDIVSCFRGLLLSGLKAVA